MGPARAAAAGDRHAGKERRRDQLGLHAPERIRPVGRERC
jgi:hypothetical protein